MLLLALFALSGQIFLTRAYSYSKAGIVSSVSYIAIIFALAFDVIYLKRFPEFLNIVGISIIMISGIAIIYSQRVTKN